MCLLSDLWLLHVRCTGAGTGRGVGDWSAWF